MSWIFLGALGVLGALWLVHALRNMDRRLLIIPPQYPRNYRFRSCFSSRPCYTGRGALFYVGMGGVVCGYYQEQGVVYPWLFRVSYAGVY